MTRKKSDKVPATTIVVFGATGDLMTKKIVPSLFNLYTNNKIPKQLNIIGFSRRELSDESFKNHISEIMENRSDAQEKDFEQFLKLFSYVRGNFDDAASYGALAEKLEQVETQEVCANKLFYLAIPPIYYKKVFNNLAHSGLTNTCTKHGKPKGSVGWTRVLVEKPFGEDLKTARDLDKLLSQLFTEEQIYRIDHYLAKEMLQNILAFRFSNNLLEESWSNKYIERIEIKLYEKLGVEKRGAFYDSVGALRDVGQNHLLQMLALVTMDHPIKFEADTIRPKRAQVIEKLLKPEDDEIKKTTFRAQYDGYKQIDGVENNSTTETYFRIEGYLNSPRWMGVPIVMESGKRLGEQLKEVSMIFKHPNPCLCPADGHLQNKVIFSMEPKEEIRVEMMGKTPGLEMQITKRDFDLPFRIKNNNKSQYTQEYEKLLLDAIYGDQTLFVSTNEVESMWKFIDPIVTSWDNDLVTLEKYKPNTNQAVERAQMKVKTVDEALKKEIAVVGLGKMGAAIARNLLEKGWKVVGYNRSPEIVREMQNEGLEGAFSIEEMTSKLVSPRVVWVMVPAGDPVDEVINILASSLQKGDIVIDGGNSLFTKSETHSGILKAEGIEFVDVGVSGGPSGARHGASLMIGGNKKLYEHLLPLFIDLAVTQGQEFFEGVGAGHFVKMVHNGIEYGMMQSIAEGFDIMANGKYRLHLRQVASVYNYGTVIESRLIEWMENAFSIFGDDLAKIPGAAGQGGGGAGKVGKSEGEWTVEVAKKLGIKTSVIEASVAARAASRKTPSYQGKIINALRNQFGGHAIESQNS